MKRWVFGIAAMGVMLPVAGFTHEFKAGELSIGHPWTRVAPKGSDMAAGYLTVTNHGKTMDVLEGAEVDGVGEVMFHQTQEKDGVATMTHIVSVNVEPGQTVTLAPGGLHLMWMELKKPLVLGEMVSGTLSFKNAGKVPVGFKVEPMGVKAVEHKH